MATIDTVIVIIIIFVLALLMFKALNRRGALTSFWEWLKRVTASAKEKSANRPIGSGETILTYE